MQEGKTVVAFSASATIDRRDFGVSFNHSLLDGSVVVGNKVVHRDRDRGRPGRLTSPLAIRWRRPGSSGGRRSLDTLPRHVPASVVACAAHAGHRDPHRRVGQDPHVLAVDLGTGGPKVAVLAATGRVVAHAFQAVGIELTDDGGAEQSPQAWWDAIVASARQALARQRRGARGRRRDRLHLAVVGHRARRRRGERPSARPSSGWTPGAPAPCAQTVRGALNVQGYSASKLASWVRRTGGAPSLSGKDPVGHIHFLRQQRPDVYAAAAVFLEPVDYLNLRLTGLARASHDSITVHWVTDNRDIDGDRLRRQPGRAWPASSAPSCPTWCRRAACSAG